MRGSFKIPGKAIRVRVNSQNIEKLREELKRLMEQQIESLTVQAFGGLSQEQLREHDERLKRIREVSADFLAALKRTRE